MIDRVLKAITALLILALSVWALDWARRNRWEDPIAAESAAAASGPTYRDRAAGALATYSVLPEAGRDAVLENLRAHVVAFSEWIRRVREEGYSVLCVGEDHEETTRAFLATRFLPRLEADTLLLETTEHELGKITQKMRWGRERVPMLGADISAVIRVVRSNNESIEIAGIEETKRQRVAREKAGFGSRDESLSVNFWGRFERERRHVVLFGALHCSDRPNWLLGRIRRQAPRRLEDRMISVRVIAPAQSEATARFTGFIQALGIGHRDYVVSRPRELHPVILEWFDVLAQMMRDYRAFVVFRPEPVARDARAEIGLGRR